MKNKKHLNLSWYSLVFLLISLFTSFETFASHIRNSNSKLNNPNSNYSTQNIETNYLIFGFERPVMFGYFSAFKVRKREIQAFRKKKPKYLNN